MQVGSLAIICELLLWNLKIGGYSWNFWLPRIFSLTCNCKVNSSDCLDLSAVNSYNLSSSSLIMFKLVWPYYCLKSRNFGTSDGATCVFTLINPVVDLSHSILLLLPLLVLLFHRHVLNQLLVQRIISRQRFSSVLLLTNQSSAWSTKFKAKTTAYQTYFVVQTLTWQDFLVLHLVKLDTK